MSDPKAQEEPTMEEILSSIRRIISEHQESEGKQQDASEDVTADVEREPDGPDPKESEDGEVDLGTFAEFALSEDDLLDKSGAPNLEAEDIGNVVDLAELDADSDSDFDETVLELTDILVDDESGSDSADEADESVMPEPDLPESAPQPEAAAEPDPVMPEPTPELVAPAEAPMGGEGEASLATSEASLVSSTAAAATSTAFSQFARGVSESQGVALDGTGRTLEELVKELLRPMLKNWLDNNLPPLAQRLVEREISKLAGRTDDNI